MTANELRELADTLEPMAHAPRFSDVNMPAACAYLRACADAMDAGFVRGAVLDPDGGVALVRNGTELRRCVERGSKLLYPLAMPAQPVSVADELDADRIEAIAHRMATFYRHDEARGHEYMFKRRELLYFAARLLAEAQPSSNACQLQSFGNSEQLTIPHGWRLVPVEPTPDMVEDGADSIKDNGGNARWSDIREAWADMLASAPTPPVAALRLPEPMTDAEAKKLGNDLSYLPTMTDVVVYVEAEVLKRVREANNG